MISCLVVDDFLAGVRLKDVQFIVAWLTSGECQPSFSDHRITVLIVVPTFPPYVHI